MSNAVDLFDFDNLNDLPEELQAKFESAVLETVHEYAGIVLAAAERGIEELNINQVIVVATRMGFDVPTVTTVRNYLNRAVKLGLIVKPSRQSYGAPAA